ncbi:unnamed protein product [Rotaria sp. Silwood2]|nr:unnamed protein product [Rotaria sp. Silwood2]
MPSYYSATHKVVVPCPFCPETMIQVRNWKRHILKIHYSKISHEYTGHNDSRIAVNTSHSTYEEADIDSNAHTATDENIIFNHQDDATINSTDPVPAYTNDLSHGNIHMLKKLLVFN